MKEFYQALESQYCSAFWESQEALVEYAWKLKAAQERIKELEQAIQHTLDTGMDRYIREALEK